MIAVALLYLQWLPAVRAVEEARGDPSTAPAFHDEVLRFLSSRAKPGERLEVPLTRNHWEAAYLAEAYPLARGWHRQLDRKVNPLFYDREHPLTPARYQRWLRENAVRWVALPTAPLDFSAEAREGAAAQRRAVPRAASHVRRLEHLGGARPRAAGVGRGAADGRGRRRLRPARDAPRAGARAPALDPLLDDRRRATAACRRTPHRAGPLVDVRRAGMLRVRARFSARGALRREPSCARAPGAPGAGKCGQPPCARPLSHG